MCTCHVVCMCSCRPFGSLVFGSASGSSPLVPPPLSLLSAGRACSYILVVLAVLRIAFLFIVPLLINMATESEMKTYLSEKVASDLLFLWGESEISLSHQFKLAMKRVTSMSRFAAPEDDRDKFKDLMVRSLGIDFEDPLEGAVVVGDLVTAWESARGCAKAEIDRKAAASASSSSQPPPIPRRDYLLMAAGFKQQEGKKPEAELPGNR